MVWGRVKEVTQMCSSKPRKKSITHCWDVILKIKCKLLYSRKISSKILFYSLSLFMYLFFSVLMGIIKNKSVLISCWRLRIKKKLAKEKSIKSDILHEFCTFVMVVD